MDIAMEETPPGGLEVLDDLCLQHVVSSTENLKDLLSLGRTCRRLRDVVAAADPAWQRLILADFGLLVKGIRLKRQYDALRRIARGEAPPPSEAAAAAAGGSQGPVEERALGGGSSPGLGAAALEAAPPGGVRLFLPFAGVSTDGGCDMPFMEFWAGHLFTPSSRTFYSSDALTSNIHCVAVLQPSGYDEADPHRAFLLDRLQLPAAYLSRDVMRSIMTDQAWEGGSGREAPDPLPALPARAVEEARRVLSQCATEVLEDLYVHCYNQMNQGRAWGRLLTRGLQNNNNNNDNNNNHPQQQHPQQYDQDAALHSIHQMAWRIWHNQRSVPFGIRQALPDHQPRLLYGTPPLRPLLRAREQQQQGLPSPDQQKQWQGPPLFRSLGLFDSVLLSRHVNVTCPLRCGALFAVVAGAEGESGALLRREDLGAGAACASATAAAAAAAAAAGGARQGLGAAAAAAHGGPAVAGGSGEAETAAEEAAAAELAVGLTNGFASLPCVQALNDATDIRAVLSAVRAGVLPSIAGYYTTGWVEWVEFERPPLAEAIQSDVYTLPAVQPPPPAPQPPPTSSDQQQQPSPYNRQRRAFHHGRGTSDQPPQASAAGPSGAGPSAAGPPPQQQQQQTAAADSAVLPDTGVTCRVLPVLWFRFSTREERRALRRHKPIAAPSATTAAAAGAGGATAVLAAAAAAAEAEVELAEAEQLLAAATDLLAGLQQVEAELAAAEPPPPPPPQMDAGIDQEQHRPPPPQQQQEGQQTLAVSSGGVAGASAAVAAAVTHGSGEMPEVRLNGDELHILVGGRPVFAASMGAAVAPMAAAAANAALAAAASANMAAAASAGADADAAAVNGGMSGVAASTGGLEGVSDAGTEEGEHPQQQQPQGQQGEDKAEDEEWGSGHDGQGGGARESGEEEEEDEQAGFGAGGGGGYSDSDELSEAMSQDEEEEDGEDDEGEFTDFEDEEGEAEFGVVAGPAGLMAFGVPIGGGGGAAAMVAAVAAAAADACNAALAEAEQHLAGAAPPAGAPTPAANTGAVGRLAAQAVILPAMPICPISQNLTALAPGVGHMYGWAAPPVAADHMVAIRLKQPWVANSLLAKLVSSEDTRPEFNRQRGGCNIDAGIVTVQGPAVLDGAGGPGPVLQLLDGVSLL